LEAEIQAVADVMGAKASHQLFRLGKGTGLQFGKVTF
jgi:hypothetical protein